MDSTLPPPDLAPSDADTPSPEQEAACAGLTYSSDEMPGIRRRRYGKGFRFLWPDGAQVTEEDTLARIRKLAIPPAYRDVWICPDPDGHLQATGRDAKGRKQYRYHRRWTELREGTKFGRMLDFCRALPHLRERVNADLGNRGLPREKVLAAVVRLLETTLIRVGNESYARENKSYGLTTLRDGHTEIEGSEVRFSFKGKSGKEWNVSLRDRRLARVVGACRDVPGDELFQYLDRDGQRHAVTSGDVNAYLREATGADFTAKDFRTWAGTVLAAMALREFESFDSASAAKRNVTRAIEQVATRLGNTPSVCRKSYVHPEVLDAYLEGDLLESLKREVEAELRNELAGLSGEEAAVLAFLRERLERETAARAREKR
ncbi:DNA topoisomerase I [Azospirillum sp. TSH7]|uniref:DNA topoisomerase IB n=1 Tax=unclassified Azospirillum TaxID=2630922 RepID=UPI000D611344|nr:MULTISPECIES: DNA topoisomerase IB [unclassified Azospirillum]PWC65384.1 DNA topoisomerase I [Azospirillum sp. TSH7]PWC66223.1 DNA topoisomerase I [Azospirillum sp. TSH20]